MGRIIFVLLLIPCVHMVCAPDESDGADRIGTTKETAISSNAGNSSQANATFDLSQEETHSNDISTDTTFLQFGWLQIYSHIETVEAHTGPADSCSDLIAGGVDGSFLKNCFYSKSGLQIEYAAEDSSSEGVVSGCWISFPSKLETKHGIKIGISRSEARKRLGSLIRSEDKERLFVGDLYYGTVLFFDNDTLNRIFIGQLAE